MYSALRKSSRYQEAHNAKGRHMGEAAVTRTPPRFRNETLRVIHLPLPKHLLRRNDLVIRKYVGNRKFLPQTYFKL